MVASRRSRATSTATAPITSVTCGGTTTRSRTGSPCGTRARAAELPGDDDGAGPEVIARDVRRIRAVVDRSAAAATVRRAGIPPAATAGIAATAAAGEPGRATAAEATVAAGDTAG